MHINRPTSPTCAESTQASQAVLREARRLHRAATTGTLSKSLPILRRVLSSDTLIDISLPELFRKRSIVQRKHILRMLAIEAGHASWELYRQALGQMTIEQLAHFELHQPEMGYPNFWFSTFAEAQDYALQHGGRCLRVGQQAVVCPDR